VASIINSQAKEQSPGFVNSEALGLLSAFLRQVWEGNVSTSSNSIAFEEEIVQPSEHQMAFNLFQLI